MRVVVGSRNPAKLKGVERAFRSFYGPVEIVAVEVDPLVPPQPVGIDEVLRGALNRAYGALRREAGDYGVGVEAGFFHLTGTSIEVQVAAVVDGSGRVGVGLSPGFPLPPAFVNALERGEAVELEEVVDRWFGTRSIGEAGGLVSLLTGGRVTREDLTYYAVVMALIPFINEPLWRAPAA
ncbi:MAG: inosine/xanthosine triphosphatase [Thermofilaceae archaeon]